MEDMDIYIYTIIYTCVRARGVRKGDIKDP